MNVINLGTKIAVCALSLTVSTVAMAQAVRTKPVAPRTAQPEVRKAAPAVRGAIEAAPQVESLEAFKLRNQGAAAATTAEKAPNSCTVLQFSQSLVDGTRFSAQDAQALVDQKLITQGVCGGQDGVVSYEPEARDNFVAAGLSVSASLGGRDAWTVPVKDITYYWAKGLSEEKTRDSGTTVSIESQLPAAEKLLTDCQLRAY